MIGKPSLQKPYAEHWTGDPAFSQLDDEASQEDRDRRRALVETARDTGDWTSLLIEGQRPTTFMMRRIPGTIARRIVDDISDPNVQLGEAEVRSIAFRVSLAGIDNGPTELMIDIPRAKHPRYGVIVAESYADMVDAVDMSIQAEARDARAQAGGWPVPKIIEGLRLSAWFHEEQRRSPEEFLYLSDCELCMQTLTREHRQSVGCGYEAPAPVGVAVIPWEPPSATRVAYDMGKPTDQHPRGIFAPRFCIGYTSTLPEVLEVARASHWAKKGELETFLGEPPAEHMLDAIDILDMAQAASDRYYMTPADKGGGQGSGRDGQ